MKVQVFWEGCADDAKEYVNLSPEASARKFVESYQRADKQHGGIVQVEPCDDETASMNIWKEDDDGKFLLFEARPVVHWNICVKH